MSRFSAHVEKFNRRDLVLLKHLQHLVPRQLPFPHLHYCLSLAH